MRRLVWLVILLAVGVAIWVLLASSRGFIVWAIVGAYFAWPAAWYFALKPIISAPGNLAFLDAPLGKVFPDPELLGDQPVGGKVQKVRRWAIRSLASFVEIGLWPAAGLTGRTLHTVGTRSARVLKPA